MRVTKSAKAPIEVTTTAIGQDDEADWTYNQMFFQRSDEQVDALRTHSLVSLSLSFKLAEKNVRKDSPMLIRALALLFLFVQVVLGQ